MQLNKLSKDLTNTYRNFKAKIYCVSKGNNSQQAYFVTIIKDECVKLNVKQGEALLLEINEQIFPVVIRKLSTSKNRYMFGFTVPYKMGITLPTKIATDFKLIKRSIKAKNRDEIKDHIKLEKIIPQKTIRDYPIYLFDIRKHLLIWIYSKGNKPFLLPKFIAIEKLGHNIFELAGAFFCEGFKARKTSRHREKFSFSNADPEQIKFFVKSCKVLLDILVVEWKVQILFSDLTKTNYLKSFWSSLGLDKNNIDVVKNHTVRAEHGVCVLNIYNSTLAEAMYYLMEHLNKQSIISKENAKYFFRGLSRGDIGISAKKGTITFSTEALEGASLFKNICHKLNLTTSREYFSKGCWNVRVDSYNNFQKIIELNLITHSERKKIFEEKFRTHTKSKFLQYLYAISLGYNDARKSAYFLNLSVITTRKHLLRLRRNGNVTVKVEAHNPYKKLSYKLNKKGERILSVYKKVMTYGMHTTTYNCDDGSCRPRKEFNPRYN